MTIQSIYAVKTDLAREMDARQLTEGVLLGDWSFQVGTGGFNPLTPDEAEPVDSGSQTLVSAVGGVRQLGNVLQSGAGASVAEGPEAGHLTVSGLASVSASVARRWLRLSGSGNTKMNGLWAIAKWNSATSVDIHNPLVDVGLELPDAGPLSWELRERCVQKVNARAVAFHGRLLAADLNGEELGEVGIFCRVIHAPSDPSLVGLSMLWASAHHPPKVKFPEMVLGYHLCVQA